MIRLAIATGFLAVFGVVAYAIVILLVKQFNNPTKTKENGTNNTDNEKV
jgi:hypothetical protein